MGKRPGDCENWQGGGMVVAAALAAPGGTLYGFEGQVDQGIHQFQHRHKRSPPNRYLPPRGLVNPRPFSAALPAKCPERARQGWA